MAILALAVPLLVERVYGIPIPIFRTHIPYHSVMSGEARRYRPYLTCTSTVNYQSGNQRYGMI